MRAAPSAKVDISAKIADMRLSSPVILSSGTAGFGRELAEHFDLRRVGAICSKGLTLEPCEGNGGARIWETPAGLLNSIGLENPGVDRFITDELPFMQTLGCAVIVNLGGRSEDEYIEGIERLNGCELDMLELNISCPNVKAGGMNFGVKTESVRSIVRLARAACKHRLSVKLSPNAEDIAAAARACEDEGADALTLVNTFLGMAIDVYARRPVFENVYAGLSGPAIKPIALRMAHQCASAVHIPIMAGGGIASARDAVEFIMAGASAVQVGTATLTDPYAAADISDGIARFMMEQKIASIEEMRGMAVRA